jgi:hypothetical protein
LVILGPPLIRDEFRFEVAILPSRWRFMMAPRLRPPSLWNPPLDDAPHVIPRARSLPLVEARQVRRMLIAFGSVAEAGSPSLT